MRCVSHKIIISRTRSVLLGGQYLPKIKTGIILTILLVSSYLLPILKTTSIQFEDEREYHSEANRLCTLICVEDDFAYVIEEKPINDYLELYDITQANKSIPQNSTAICSNYDRLVVKDRFAYTLCFLSSVTAINCSNPTSLYAVFSLSSSALEPSVYWFDICDWYLFIDFFGELSIYNYTNFQYPPVELNVTFPLTTGYVVHDYYLYMPQSNGFEIIDFHNLTNPKSMSNYTDVYNFNFWKVYGNYTVLVDTDEMIHIIDVSSKSAPEEVGYFGWMFHDVKEIKIRDDYLFALYQEDFRIYNITDLDSITLLGEFDGSTYGSYFDFDIGGNYAYLVGNYDVNGSVICVVDISDLANPQYIKPIPSPTGNGFNFFDLSLLRMVAIIILVPLAVIVIIITIIAILVKKLGTPRNAV